MCALATTTELLQHSTAAMHIALPHSIQYTGNLAQHSKVCELAMCVTVYGILLLT
jgi:hypothetical protein